jgi:uncharacterized protein
MIMMTRFNYPRLNKSQTLAIRSLIYLCLSAVILASCSVSKKSNSLINENSPYLLQHAYNPVAWQSVSSTRLDTDKLMIISIGYASCHWCHVMEKETFSDTNIAELMNKNFTNIKVDREERPDVDNLYMLACQMTNETGCGWPLNVIALPDGRPVWIGSYLSKNEWTEKLNYFLEVKLKSPNVLIEYADHLKESMQANQSLSPKLDNDKLNIPAIIEDIKKELDYENGGLKGIPKFPLPTLYNFLLKYNSHSSDELMAKGIELTLDKMIHGGLYDHLAGGFSRYSTDDKWIVPHFEKMLYDNAQMISLYARASKSSPKHAETVRQTIDFMEKIFNANKGGFYSSIDADGSGKEGTYYIWTKSELEKILGYDSQSYFQYYNITEKGNFVEGQNILVRNKNVEDLNVHILDKKVLEVRDLRVPPRTDTKIITSWNALMVKAYVDAYKYIGEDTYLQSANSLAQFLSKNYLSPDGKLKRLSYQSQSGYLDDYAFMAEALIDLYQVTFDQKWLEKSRLIADYVISHFNINGDSLFVYSENNDLFTSPSAEVIDGVTPSSNAIFTGVLHDLGVLYQSSTYTQLSNNMTRSMSETIKNAQQKSSYYAWIDQTYLQQSNPHEIMIIGRDALSIAKSFIALDNIIIMGSTEKENLPMLKNKLIKNKTMIYVCKNNICKLPTDDVAIALNQLKT